MGTADGDAFGAPEGTSTLSSAQLAPRRFKALERRAAGILGTQSSTADAVLWPSATIAQGECTRCRSVFMAASLNLLQNQLSELIDEVIKNAESFEMVSR